MRPSTDSSNPILTDEQVCELLGITHRTLRTWRRIRGFPHVKLSKKSIRYRQRDIEEWLENHGVAHPVIAA